MKTKILGIIAIAIAISLSAFTAPKKIAKHVTDPYWYLVTDGIPKGAHAVPAADATFLGQSATPPSGTSCGSGNNQCLSGFDSNQVNPMTDELKDDSEISSHQSAFQN